MVSRRLAGFGTTIFTEISARATAAGAINLAQGFPDFDGPDFVKEAAIQAIRDGHAQYARMTGVPALHEAIAAYMGRRRGVHVTPHEGIVVTSGATEALHDVVVGTCDVGDEVILIEPFYDAYAAVVRMAGAVPRGVPLVGPDWHLDIDALDEAFGPRTRLLLLNTPHNPTGHVFTVAELDAIAERCVRHGVTCVSDEVYEELVYVGRHVSIATRPGMADRTVTISSLGKTFSLTGWKVGWAVGAPAVLAPVRMAHQFVTFATATPLQVAAAVALAAPDAVFDGLRDELGARRRQLGDGLSALGFDVDWPDGGYFIPARFGAFGWRDDVAAVDALIAVGGVAAIPPSPFYLASRRPRDWVRFAFCKREATIAAALDRLSTRLVRVGSG